MIPGYYLRSPSLAGHPDQQIHSGEKALIHPWVVSGLGKRQVLTTLSSLSSVCIPLSPGNSEFPPFLLLQVTSLAAGKHHTIVATSAGEVFSWGSNKDGKLGYAGVDTQPVPKK